MLDNAQQHLQSELIGDAAESYRIQEDWQDWQNEGFSRGQKTWGRGQWNWMYSVLLLQSSNTQGKMANSSSYYIDTVVCCWPAMKSLLPWLLYVVQKAGGLLGVTSRGLLILGLLLVFILILLVIIVVLAALWPRTKAQEAPKVCDTPACLRAAAQRHSSKQSEKKRGLWLEDALTVVENDASGASGRPRKQMPPENIVRAFLRPYKGQAEATMAELE
ncbi:hypothetical protein DAPPUDRAFT_259939 [Daphnia pulex]|uniref:Uncharacterized protein n=1 Tax=Daphnia pulex TaxID=6669 RepID=E9HI61_DAPPU|nr:hypothetical protein DAPPUDRAFT_259939 [Daphnia pulex]|eukprot:EFX68569.1 hypothetical protein DAPPUDRAFT_259939 [Daphnia pulex]